MKGYVKCGKCKRHFTPDCIIQGWCENCYRQSKSFARDMGVKNVPKILRNLGTVAEIAQYRAARELCRAVDRATPGSGFSTRMRHAR